MRQLAVIRDRPVPQGRGPGGRSLRPLIDAALAVNAAATIEAAFDLLAERARILLSAATASVVVWDPERRTHTVRAAAGGPGNRRAAGTASSVSVPIPGGRGGSTILQAGWRTPCTRAHLDAAVETLSDLVGLTRIAARTHVELGERAATESLERYDEDFLDALPTAVCVTDPDTGALVKVNAALADLTGYSTAEMLGLTPPHSWLEPTESPRPGGESGMLVRHKGGRLTRVEIRRLPVRNGDGELTAWISIVALLGERPPVGQPPVLRSLPAKAAEA